jgi:hypothetical protein
VFAFIWDVTVDWGLIQLDTLTLRKNVHFSDPFWYMLAVGLNACFRILKIGSQLSHVHPFCVDLAEIVRRWIWVLFRFEYEFIKHDNEKRVPI